jgi:hypothetical protein
MAGAGKLIAALALAVVLAHMAALQWLGTQWRQAEVLKPLATPMFTRQIAQQAPVLPPVTVAKAVPKKRIPLAAPSAVASMPDVSKTLPDPAVQVAVAAPPTPPPLTQAPTPQSSTTELATPTAASGTVTQSVAGTPASGPATSYLDQWPADTRLTYKVGGYFRGDISGDAQVQWLRVGDKYEVTVDISIGVLANTKMTSQGEIRTDGLHPLAYEEGGRGAPRRVMMADSGIVFSNGNTLQRPQGLQDTASQFVELAQQFASGRTLLGVGNSVSFPMARPGAVDYWTYDVTEKVTLNTPKLGAIEAFHLKPRPLAAPRGNITAEMWFAPSLQHLPVRIRIAMGEAVYLDLLVDKIEQK